MSNWLQELEDRKESLETASKNIDSASHGQFIDAEEASSLNRMNEEIQQILKPTEEELSLLTDNDWEMVVNRCESILEQLQNAAEIMEQDGLATTDGYGDLDAALDDEPAEITAARTYIDSAMKQWRETLDAAEEMRGETSSGGLY